MSGFNVGEVFKIPCDREFGEDFFIVIGTRNFMGNQILDGICDGAEDIQITVHAKDVVKVS
jgi:hypothetical protein